MKQRERTIAESQTCFRSMLGRDLLFSLAETHALGGGGGGGGGDLF